MNERQERFIDLLRQIFELDKADLDFGIYRILNIRRHEIEEFFTTRLPQKITETLQPFATGNKDNIRQRMKEIEQMFAGIDIESLPESNPNVAEYKQLKQQLQQGTDLSALESDVYSALYSFFSRYYDEGDFISKRRYKEGVYAIPYEGEEVKLYWANQDQYYIKTSENFKDYTFVADDYTIHFRLVDATTEQNNNKETQDKKRKFMLFVEDETQYPGIKTFSVEGNEVSIRFLYDVPKDSKVKYDETNLATINDWINAQPDVQLRVALLRIVNPEAKADKRKTVIKKHLDAYVAKNSFDYFIHKDLGGFLTRELDFFIKNEVMHLDDLDTASEARVGSYLAKVRAIKRVGKDIITFLAQLENFQKRLWLKKKFVVETNWCITLDRIPAKYYDEIRKNKKQVEEWKEMYAIHELVPDLEHTEPFTEEPSLLFLQQNQNLIVDTKHFTEDFKQKLISEIDGLDKFTGALMIYSDNFHALNLLKEKYFKLVHQVYIDPPFNLQHNGDYLYKTDYKDSSWLSLLDNRIRIMRTLLEDDGIFMLRCDINGNSIARQMLNNIFGYTLFECELLVQRIRKNVTDQGRITIPLANDSLFVYMNSENSVYSNPYKALEKTREDYWRRMDDSSGYRNPPERIIFGMKFLPYKHDAHFKFSNDTIRKMCKEGRIRLKCKDCKYEHYDGEISSCPSCGGKNLTPQYKVLATDEMVYDTNWMDIPGYSSDWDFSTENSLPLLERAIKIGSKNKDIVLDCFGGSGTTGHAVISLNRKEQWTMKSIQVDMGTQFVTTLVPRMKKVTYSSQWTKGKLKKRAESVNHIMKYMSLESYEDALSNIELKKNGGMAEIFGDDYILQYMLDIETRDSLLNVKAFTTPFEYEMRITEKNETKLRKVDVCETFNYLIGLTVVHQGAIQRYQTVEARNPEYEGAVDLVVDRDGLYQFRQIEGTLRDGKKVLVIWRNITKDLLASNAALDAYFLKYRLNPRYLDYDIIYVNGDSNLENLRRDEDHWKVERIEVEFNKRMFEEN